MIQEVTLPSKVTVVFGRFKAPLRMYALASSNLERHKSSCCVGVLPPGDRNSLPMEDFCRKMLAIVEGGNLWRKKESITLLTLLRLYYSKDATDARDKVYGLLGLVTDWGNSRAIAPNYTMRTSELYQEVALRSVEVSGSLAILTFRTNGNYQKMMGDLQKIKEGVTYHKVLPLTASASEKYMQDALRKKHKSTPDAVELDMPSWTPDWETINKRGYEVGTSERINRAFIFDACASRPSPPSPTRYTSSSILTRTRVLTLSALRIGTVDDDNFKHFMPFLVNHSSAIKIDRFPLPSNPDDLDQPYVAGGTEYDAVWRTVCGDAFFVGSHSSAGLDGHTMFRRTTLHDKAAVQAWRRWLGRQKTMSGKHRAPAINDFSSPEEHAMATEADRAIRSVGLQRRYFNTDTGYMGMGSSALAGDEVFVLLGSRTPYLLRSMGDIGVEGLGATRLYTLIGEAYVQGVMDGELVKKSEVEIQELLVI